MTEFNGFPEFEEKLRELAEEFKERTEGRISGSGQDPQTTDFISPEGMHAKDHIGIGISRAMNERRGIVEKAQDGGSRWLTEEAEASIQHDRVMWNWHEFGATDELVRHHEFGTSTRATDTSKATINAPDGNGYVIPMDGYDSLPFGPRQVAAMEELNFEFVVHPGVKGRHFMRDALLGNTWLIEDRVAEELDKLKIDI